jgi:hypothetical protein
MHSVCMQHQIIWYAPIPLVESLVGEELEREGESVRVRPPVLVAQLHIAVVRLSRVTGARSGQEG